MTAMEYSLGFGEIFPFLSALDINVLLMPLLVGAINILFALPAIRTIDTLGRRKWLVLTLPLMCLFMAAAAASFSITQEKVSIEVVAMWLFCKSDRHRCPASDSG